MVRPDLCDYSDAYIIVKGTIDRLASATNNVDEKVLYSKIMLDLDRAYQKNSFLDNAEIMLMYNLLEYSNKCSMTSESQWSYYRDDIVGIDDNASQGKSLQQKTKIARKTSERPPQPGNEGDAYQLAQPPVPTLNVKVTIPLKNLSNFWRSLDLTLMNCELELTVSYSKNSVLVEHYNKITGVDFVITSTKRYVSVVNFFINIRLRKYGGRI